MGGADVVAKFRAIFLADREAGLLRPPAARPDAPGRGPELGIHAEDRRARALARRMLRRWGTDSDRELVAG